MHVDIAPQNRLVGFRVWANEFVEDVRERLQGEQGVPMDRTRLLFGGCALEDSRTLNDYDIREGATVTVALRAPCKGGMETGSQAPPSQSAPPPPPPPREGSGDGRGEEEEGMTFDDYLDGLTDEWGEPAAADAPAGRA